MFLGKRDRLMKSAWRHGIFGVDDADASKTQVFYADDKCSKDKAQSEKD